SRRSPRPRRPGRATGRPRRARGRGAAVRSCAEGERLLDPGIVAEAEPRGDEQEHHEQDYGDEQAHEPRGEESTLGHDGRWYADGPRSTGRPPVRSSPHGGPKDHRLA